MRLDKKAPSTVVLWYNSKNFKKYLGMLSFKSYSSIEEIKFAVIRDCKLLNFTGKVLVRVYQYGGYYKNFVMIVKRTNKTI